MALFAREERRLVWTGSGETLVVEPWGSNSIRVRDAWKTPIVDTDWALLPQPSVAVDIDIDGCTATLRNGRITAKLTAETREISARGYRSDFCRIEFYNDCGELLLAETERGGSLELDARHFEPSQHGLSRMTVTFAANADERLAGMGLYQQDVLDLKGGTFELAHRNSQASIPFVLSSRGYGFLWHNPAIGRATFASNRTEWVAEAASQIDYWVTAGATPAEISEAYAQATGFVPDMPEFGLGFWQSKLRYWNQHELLEVAREYHRRGLPVDVIVADFFHWPKMGDYRFEPEFWPDPQAMVTELHDLGMELMVSVWPQVATASENFDRFRKCNGLVAADRGLQVQMAFQGPSMFVDMTSETARRTLWDLCRDNYRRYGIKLFWLDEAEPEYGVYDYDNYRYEAGPAAAVGNIYPQQFARAFFEGQQASGENEIINLVRCAWAGSQRYGALVWSGDIGSTFADLRRQVTAAIHMGVAGIPWFTTDIGGFHNGQIDDPAFHELLVRWFQFGAFCPVMRLHGDRKPTASVTTANGEQRCDTGAANELWSFGDDVYQILERYIKLRDRLRPYTRSLMEAAHRHGQPVVRGLFYEFPHDPCAWENRGEYMFGSDLLVAPVLQAGATEREVYLPAGAKWSDLATGEVVEGGTVHVVAAPLEHIPVFARNGQHLEIADALP